MKIALLHSLRLWYGLKTFEIFARSRGFAFRIAQDAAELEAVYWIRWKVYTEAGYISRGAYPDKQMSDRFDRWSVNLLALYKGEPVGTLRLTPLEKGSPVLELFVVPKWPEPTRSVEIGRFAVLGDARKGRMVAVGLVGKMTEVTLRWQKEMWVGYAPRPLLQMFRPLFRYEILPTLPIGERERAARRAMAGYFERYGKRVVVFQSKPEWVTAWRWSKVIGRR